MKLSTAELNVLKTLKDGPRKLSQDANRQKLQRHDLIHRCQGGFALTVAGQGFLPGD